MWLILDLRSDFQNLKKSIFEFFINYEKTALQIFFYFVRMFFGS